MILRCVGFPGIFVSPTRNFKTRKRGSCFVVPPLRVGLTLPDGLRLTRFINDRLFETDYVAAVS